MRLLFNGTRFRISQMGPDFLFVDSPVSHPPGRAVIELKVDDAERSWAVILPLGMRQDEQRVELATAA